MSVTEGVGDPVWSIPSQSDASIDGEWLSAHLDQAGTSQTTVEGVTLVCPTCSGSNRPGSLPT